MRRPISLDADIEGAAIERPRLGVVHFGFVKAGEFVEERGVDDVGGGDFALGDGNRFFGVRIGFLETALLIKCGRTAERVLATA